MDEASDLDRRFHDALAQGEASEVLRISDELQRENRFAESRERLEAAWEALPSEPRIAERLLELYQRYHNWRAFDAVLEQALDAHPSAGELHFAAGIGYEARRDWQEAWEAFGRAAALAPEEAEPVLRQARAYRLAHRVDDAIRVLKKALRRHDRHAPMHAAIGYAWIQKGRADRAVDCFRKARERQPDWQPYINDLAGALMLCERWQEAAQAAIESLRLRKKDERAWTVFAIANYRLGDLERAEQGYRNAVRAAQSPTRAKGNYGLFLARRPERLLEAVRLLKEAYEAHPDWTEVEERLAEITDPSV
ncbi:MAG: tetratricopeptide repeat protein [Planctomycetota bacterium]|nr:tetratricopeptide repeat protein [Planctomycetota bacterium]